MTEQIMVRPRKEKLSKKRTIQMKKVPEGKKNGNHAGG